MRSFFALFLFFGSVVQAEAYQSPFAWKVNLNQTYRCSDGSVMRLQAKNNYYTFEVNVGNRHDDSDASIVPPLMPLYFIFDKNDEAFGGVMIDEFKRRMGTVTVLKFPPVTLRLNYEKRNSVICVAL